MLLTRRGPNVHLPGRWELPGGKVQPGETIPAALERELMEELALRIDNAEPLVCVEHRYARRTVRLHVMVAALPCRVRLDGVEHRWVAPEALDAVELPPANTAINEALRSWLWNV